MELAMHVRKGASDEDLAFACQVGATHVLVSNPQMTDDGVFGLDYLIGVKRRIEEAGLELAVVKAGLRGSDRKTLGDKRALHKVVLGRAGRDQQIDNWRQSLRNMGEVGIPVLAYDFTDFFLRTSRRDTATYGRGGGRFSAFDMNEATVGFINDDLGIDVTGVGERTDEDIWDNFAYFLKPVVPAAEELASEWPCTQTTLRCLRWTASPASFEA